MTAAYAGRAYQAATWVPFAMTYIISTSGPGGEATFRKVGDLVGADDDDRVRDLRRRRRRAGLVMETMADLLGAGARSWWFLTPWSIAIRP